MFSDTIPLNVGIRVNACMPKTAATNIYYIASRPHVCSKINWILQETFIAAFILFYLTCADGITFRLSDLWPKYLKYWFILTVLIVSLTSAWTSVFVQIDESCAI